MTQDNRSGFTLIEIAIALMVFGLLLTGMIQLYRIVRIQNLMIETDGNMIVVQSALQKFAIRNGRYPLPAPYNLAPGDANYGAEFAGVPGPCAVGMGTVCTTPGGRDVLPPGGNDPAVIGAVPFAALGLPIRYSRDAWGQKFTYAVTAALTATATFQDDRGALRVIDRLGTDTVGTISNIHYVLVSHGADNAGAFTLYGPQTVACAALGSDRENCDNDGIFNNNFDFIGAAPYTEYTRYLATVAGAQHYDDFLRYATTTTGDTWTRTANAPDIYSRNTENIRIGPGGIPAYKLEVMGNVRSNELQTNRICDFTDGCDTPGPVTGLSVPAYPPLVFTPAIFGGTPNTLNARRPGGGISCGDLAMTGLGLSDEECGYNHFPAGYTVGAPCPGGMRARGTDAAGHLRCE